MITRPSRAFRVRLAATVGGVGNLVLNQGGSVAEHGQSRTFAVGE